MQRQREIFVAEFDSPAATLPVGVPQRAWREPNEKSNLFYTATRLPLNASTHPEKRDKRKTLHVFVSSPNDCREERAAVRKIVSEISESDIAKHLNLRLEPLFWEDLPGGQGDSDAQSRIENVLKHRGHHNFQIYVGFMGRRVGTATLDAPSGTIDEFRSALAGYGKKRLPSEVLFYFTAPQKSASRPWRSFERS